MEYAINFNSILPVRAEASERSEMVTQLLFGEHCSILDEKDSFFRIKNYFDDYEGWVDKKMLTLIDKNEYEKLSVNPVYRTQKPITNIYSEVDNSIYRLTMGSILPNYNNSINRSGSGNFNYKVSDNIIKRKTDNNIDKIISTALLMLNTPYLWGGKSVMGIDCSGFIQVIFATNGILLPRDASQQALEGESVNWSNIQTGDLLFFEKKRKITHVGMYLNEAEIIHASGKVRIDTIDLKGIYNKETEEYTHNLASIKRIL